MKLSIIVPVYNAEKYLRQCLDSIVGQTLEDYEVIIINDGSKDSSGDIIEFYVNQYPQLVRALTVENGGQGRARNIGIGMARGDYLGFVDSDDWVEPDMFEAMYTAAAEAGADMAVCDALRFGDGAERYLPISGYAEPMAIATEPWDKIYKRSTIADICFPEGLWYEDLEFVIKAMLCCKTVVPVHRALYHYRCGHASTMNNKNAEKNLDMISIMENMKGYMLPRGYREEFEYILICHLLLDTINRVNIQDGENKQAVIQKLRGYAHENIADLFACPAYKRQSAKRRIVMALNYYGLHGVARMMFKK